MNYPYEDWRAESPDWQEFKAWEQRNEPAKKTVLFSLKSLIPFANDNNP